jgi:hypothetical protein
VRIEDRRIGGRGAEPARDGLTDRPPRSHPVSFVDLHWAAFSGLTVRERDLFEMVAVLRFVRLFSVVLTLTPNKTNRSAISV